MEGAGSTPRGRRKGAPRPRSAKVRSTPPPRGPRRRVRGFPADGQAQTATRRMERPPAVATPHEWQMHQPARRNAAGSPTPITSTRRPPQPPAQARRARGRPTDRRAARGGRDSALAPSAHGETQRSLLLARPEPARPAAPAWPTRPAHHSLTTGADHGTTVEQAESQTTRNDGGTNTHGLK